MLGRRVCTILRGACRLELVKRVKGRFRHVGRYVSSHIRLEKGYVRNVLCIKIKGATGLGVSERLPQCCFQYLLNGYFILKLNLILLRVNVHVNG